MATVTLARAIYSRASTLLLDDVISAVDAQTSHHIIEHCFRSPLMAGRTIIVATHAVESLAPLASQAVFLHDGRAVWQGTGPDLLGSEHMAHLKTEPSSNSSTRNKSSECGLEKRRNSAVFEVAEFLEVKEALPKTPKQLIIEEQQSKGSIDMNYWLDLLRLNGSASYWIILILLTFGTCLMPVAYRRALEWVSLTRQRDGI